MSSLPELFEKKSLNVIGVMSGTSLDGLDICLCNFTFENSRWTYSIIKTTTIGYDSSMIERLSSAFNSTGNVLTKLDYDYGRWIGSQVKAFSETVEIRPDFVASHGHTIFHKPSEGYTLQIGKGSAISVESDLPCICDFRSTDVCLGGQGAPLVPIGDKHLFSEFDICLNLGGFANLSYENKGTRLAFDIGPCNIILNAIAKELGVNFDKDGTLGKKGNVNNELLLKLNNLDFYKKTNPKSLGREWIEDIFQPIINEFKISPEDKLSTLYEHISTQITQITNNIEGKTVLATGGGAHNGLLIHLLRSKSKHSIVIPDKNTIDFKEALIFAFLGVLYIKGKANALASVTGAKNDSISGCLYY